MQDMSHMVAALSDFQWNFRDANQVWRNSVLWGQDQIYATFHLTNDFPSLVSIILLKLCSIKYTANIACFVSANVTVFYE